MTPFGVAMPFSCALVPVTSVAGSVNAYAVASTVEIHLYTGISHWNTAWVLHAEKIRRAHGTSGGTLVALKFVEPVV